MIIGMRSPFNEIEVIRIDTCAALRQMCSDSCHEILENLERLRVNCRALGKEPHIRCAGLI
jgi:hypothetical protein